MQRGRIRSSRYIPLAAVRETLVLIVRFLQSRPSESQTNNHLVSPRFGQRFANRNSYCEVVGLSLAVGTFLPIALVSLKKAILRQAHMKSDNFAKIMWNSPPFLVIQSSCRTHMSEH